MCSIIKCSSASAEKYLAAGGRYKIIYVAPKRPIVSAFTATEQKNKRIQILAGMSG